MVFKQQRNLAEHSEFNVLEPCLDEVPKITRRVTSSVQIPNFGQNKVLN